MVVHFQAVKRKLFDPSNKEFIVKGINLHGPNFGIEGTQVDWVDSIKNCWKFNLIRLNVRAILGSDYLRYNTRGAIASNSTIDEIIQAYTSAQIVVLISTHDCVGRYPNGSELVMVKNFYRDLSDRYKENPYVWYSTASAPGNLSSTLTQWVNYQREIITTIRDESSALNPLCLEAHYFGQDAGEYNNEFVKEENSAILSKYLEVQNFNKKRYRNIFFGVHFYDQWVSSLTRMENYLDRVQNKNICLIVSEYGTMYNGVSVTAARDNLLEAVPQRNIGRIVWAWSDELTLDGNGRGQSINSCTIPTNLTEKGQTVFNDNRRKEALLNLTTGEVPTQETIGAKTNYLEAKIINHLFGNVPYVAPTKLWLAIFSTDPTEDGVGNEITSRISINQWTIAAGEAFNTETVELPAVPDGQAWTISYYALFDAQTGGNALYYGKFNRSKRRVAGESLVIAPTELKISEH